MPKPKKTIRVGSLADSLNIAIKAKIGHREEQAALCWVIEKVLMEAHAYRGFKWLLAPTQEVDDPDYYARYYYIPFDTRG